MIHEIALKEIISENRGREDYGDLEQLAESIKTFGLIHPIVIDENKHLIVGGRRLAAHFLLGLPTIKCIYFNELSDQMKKEVELEENISRKDLTWQEEIRIKNELVKLKSSRLGKDWDSSKTSDIFNESSRTTRKDLELMDGVKKFPELLKEENKTTAATKLRRLKDDRLRAITAQTSNFDSTGLYHGDCIEVMKSLPGSSVDLILFDPPFGESYDKKTTEDGTWHECYGSYEDSLANAIVLVSEVLKESNRLLKDGAHMFMFFSLRLSTSSLFATAIHNAGLSYQEQPLFWLKSGNQNYQPYHRFTINYEPIIFIWKGSKPRDLAHEHPAAFSHLLDPDKKHPAQKPVALYKDLIELSAKLGEVVLDPTAGSGVSVATAKSLGRRFIGIEKEERWYQLMLETVNQAKGGENND